jgi:hypothetical protein
MREDHCSQIGGGGPEDIVALCGNGRSRRQGQQQKEAILSDEEKLSYAEMQTTIQNKLVAIADSEGLGDVTILLNRFRAEL